jgi:hypothetical protein
MIKLFRNIRQKLLAEGKTKNYFKYAIGEIVLVVIGILIALQINNWNEERKDKSRIRTNLYSISEDIQEDIQLFQNTFNSLHRQNFAARNIVPIMESENKLIQDSLKFILDFNTLTTTPIITKRNNTWDYLNSSGAISEFPDAKLLKMLQDYYNNYTGLTTNFTNSANPERLELRKLKYELFKDVEHRKFFPTDTPIVPNKEVYDSIFVDKRVLAHCRFIGSTAIYFEAEFQGIQQDAENIIAYIKKNYRQMN